MALAIAAASPAGAAGEAVRSSIAGVRCHVSFEATACADSAGNLGALAVTASATPTETARCSVVITVKKDGTLAACIARDALILTGRIRERAAQADVERAASLAGNLCVGKSAANANDPSVICFTSDGDLLLLGAAHAMQPQ